MLNQEIFGDATLDVPIPFSRPLEVFVEPSVQKIVTAVRSLLG